MACLKQLYDTEEEAAAGTDPNEVSAAEATSEGESGNTAARRLQGAPMAGDLREGLEAVLESMEVVEGDEGGYWFPTGCALLSLKVPRQI